MVNLLAAKQSRLQFLELQQATDMKSKLLIIMLNCGGIAVVWKKLVDVDWEKGDVVQDTINMIVLANQLV